MMKRFFALLAVTLFLTLTSCAGSQSTTEAIEHRITGTFSYSNSIITDYYVEHAVALIDMYGFVQRDMEWEIPVDSKLSDS